MYLLSSTLRKTKNLMAQAKKTRRPRGSLSKEVILQAAEKRLVEDGVEALSIRKIAEELNAGTMSIYNHFSSKQDILSALVAAFVERAHQKEYAMDDWADWLYQTFQDIYRASVSESHFLLLMIRSDNIGVSSLVIFERSLKCLSEAGFEPDKAITLFHQLLSFTLGAAMLQVSLNQRIVDASSLDGEKFPYGAQYWGQARQVMLGKDFDQSLLRLIKSYS